MERCDKIAKARNEVNKRSEQGRKGDKRVQQDNRKNRIEGNTIAKKIHAKITNGKRVMMDRTEIKTGKKKGEECAQRLQEHGEHSQKK